MGGPFCFWVPAPTMQTLKRPVEATVVLLQNLCCNYVLLFCLFVEFTKPGAVNE